MIFKNNKYFAFVIYVQLFQLTVYKMLPPGGTKRAQLKLLIDTQCLPKKDTFQSESSNQWSVRPAGILIWLIDHVQQLGLNNRCWSVVLKLVATQKPTLFTPTQLKL